MAPLDKIVTVTPGHTCDARIAVAGCRAGASGILDLSFARDRRSRDAALGALARFAGSQGRWGIRWDTLGMAERTLGELPDSLSDRIPVLALAGVQESELEPVRKSGKRIAARVLLEVESVRGAHAAQAAGYDGCIVKGYEAGGWVQGKSSLILLQELVGELTIPFWIQGGMGLHTAAAAVLAGAAGVVLCEQLWLAKEGPVAPEQSLTWNLLDGSETTVLGEDGTMFRLFNRSARGKLRELDRKAAEHGDWKTLLVECLLNSDELLIPAGQDIAFSGELARRFGTAGRIVCAFRDAIDDHLQLAKALQPLAPDSGLAKIHGTRYPIVQGPMTRVSDVAPFAEAVARAGGLPFLALAVMRRPAIRGLLQEVKARMQQLPWGVGILGFVPRALRQEQLEVVKEVRPPFAIIAGGRPSQAAELETLSISTYLHVPSPGLLEQFLQGGSRKFVFEGSECGGHIGPRTSFVLWQLAVEKLIEADIPDPEAIQLLFAGGVHDALSAAMLATIAAPLAARGMHVGTLMGSAYLFTREAVQTGAIVQEYQEQALATRTTAVLRTSLGYATRCASTPFCNEFSATRQNLVRAGKSAEDVTETLERINIGRLRIASKGIAHASSQDDDDHYVSVDTDTQIRRGMYMLGDVAILRDRITTVGELHEDVSTGSGLFLDRAVLPLAEPGQGSERADIAIVGMACLFPGAFGVRALWENILNRLDAVSEVADERWPAAIYFDEDRTARDKIYSKSGGFLKDIPFDPTRYGIPPASLGSIEPIQLLALEVARLALEDAGFDHLPFPHERTAVVFAVGGMSDLACDYIFRTQLMRYLPTVDGVTESTRQHIMDSLYQRLPEWTEDSFPGILGNVVAGRVANRLNLGGSNYTVDAACAASLAALSSGLDQLYSGDADIALVGAADGMNNAVSFMSFAKTQALSPRGHCFPFSSAADGIAVSEGVAALVLKRIADAERDGDEIYGLVKAVGSSSDGRNRSLTAPHAGGQIECVRRAYEKSRVAPGTVELLEAHGTGTAVGDKAEIESLMTAFGESRAQRQHCAIGSIKSMIGHTKVAAGLAGIIKCVLALKHHVLPPTIGVETPNAHVDFEQTPFYINTETRPWLESHEEHPRRCGVSAFGFGGTNFHAVLEEYTGRYQISDDMDFNPRNAEIFAWSRAHPSEIMDEARRLLDIPHLEVLELGEVAHSVWLAEKACAPQGEPAKSRLAIVATSTADLKQKLAAALRDLSDHTAVDDPDGVYFRRDAVPPGGVCFLFPGQGSQRINMLRDLVVSMRPLQRLFEDADAVLRKDLSQPLSRYIYPLPVFSNAKRKRQQADLNATEVAQPALGVAELAAFDALGLFGLRPDFLAGHSYGEYAALCAAGAISREQLIRLSWIRGHVAAEVSQAVPGTMAAVGADAETTAKLVDAIGLSVSVASLNAPDQTIIAGSVDSVDGAIAALAEHRITASRVAVTAAFHTEAMRGAAKALAAELAQIEVRTPTRTVFSNTLTTAFPEDPDEIRQVLARHIAEPLRFTEQIQNLYQAGARVFVEAGPGKVLSGLVDRILGDMPHTTLSMDAPGTPGWLQLAHLLSRSLVLGLPVEIGSWFRGRGLSQRTAEQLAEEARRRAEPGPTVWRVNPGRAVPWNQTPDDTVGSVEPGEFPGRMPLQRNVHNARPPRFVSQAQVTGPDRRHDMSKHDGPVKPVGSQAAAGPTDSETLVAELQRNLSQLIELQKDQQRSMQGLLEMQQQLASAVLRGGVARSSAKTTREPEVSLPPDSSAVSGPSAREIPQVAALPPLNVEPMAPAMAVEASPPAPAPGITPGDQHDGPAGQPATLDDGVPSTDEFKSILLRSVSERTGYPEQMLNLDAHMEADLGIDSIKLIEILSTLEDYRDRLNSGSIEDSFEELGELKTLRSIVEWYDKNRTRTLAEAADAKKKT